MKPKKNVTVSLRGKEDRDLWHQAKEKAHSLDLSLSMVIRNFVTRWLAGDIAVEIKINGNDEQE